MKILRKLLFCFLALWLSGGTAWSAPLDKAKAAFGKGDYKKAGKLATKAGKKLKSKSEKAEALVLSGAAAIKQGKSGKAKFRKALKLDPNVMLPAEAEGDPKISKAFASAQKKAGSKVSSGGDPTSTDTITKTAGAADRSGGNLKNYLPFGINNFMQGKTLTAVGLGGAQALGIFVYMNRTGAVAAANSDATAVIADAEANNATTTPEFLEFLDANDAFIKQSNSEATLALMLLTAGYAFSVVDALFDPFGTATAALDEGGSQQAYAKLGSQWENRRIDSSWKFDLQMIPSQDPSVMVMAKQSF